MKKTRISLFLLLIIGYLLIWTSFCGWLIMKAVLSPELNKPSSIPSLSVTELGKINKGLENRTKLIPSEKIDLKQFQFGKEEPFF